MHTCAHLYNVYLCFISGVGFVFGFVGSACSLPFVNVNKRMKVPDANGAKYLYTNFLDLCLCIFEGRRTFYHFQRIFWPFLTCHLSSHGNHPPFLFHYIEINIDIRYTPFKRTKNRPFINSILESGCTLQTVGIFDCHIFFFFWRESFSLERGYMYIYILTLGCSPYHYQPSKKYLKNLSRTILHK